MTTNQQHTGPDKLAKRVFDKIASERPRPRWEFILKNYVFWSLGIAAVILSAFAFSAALFEVNNIGWSLATVTHGDFFNLLVSAAPYLWVTVLALFLLVGYYNVRQTKRGYRYPLVVIALGAILTSMTFGLVLYSGGFGGPIEEILENRVPFYQSVISGERAQWLAPEEGFLSGQVVSTTVNGTMFTIRDFMGRLWMVDGTSLSGVDRLGIVRGGTVRIVGVPTTATSTAFQACFAFRWEVSGDFRSWPVLAPMVVPAQSFTTNAFSDADMACEGILSYQQLRDIDD